jgi:hypothetical protein
MRRRRSASGFRHDELALQRRHRGPAGLLRGRGRPDRVKIISNRTKITWGEIP